MNEPESRPTAAEPESATSELETFEPETADSEAPPEPEPWTPERVLSWNAYYDLYVALGVLLLAFLGSANKITNSQVWVWLQTGRLAAEQGAPVTSDPFSYTMSGQPWVNIPWLFEWLSAVVYDAVRVWAPADPNDPMAFSDRAETYGAGALIALHALIRAMTVLALLAIRRPGPGLWWVAVCVAAVLVVVTGPATVSPATWGGLFLALELLLLHWAVNLGRPWAAWGLVPLFLLWANVDASFLFGLVVLAMMVVGTIQPRWAWEPERRLSLPMGLAVLVASAAVCLVNPAFHRILEMAVPLTPSWLAGPDAGPMSIDQISLVGTAARNHYGEMIYRWHVSLYLILVGLGLASFALNYRRFALGRFLVFGAAALLWASWFNLFALEFGLVLAVTLALNGQEWYHDRVGTEGRLGRGWAVWSIGGRAITIIVIFAVIARGLTGFGAQMGEHVFGFDFDPDLFAFEAADYLKTAPIAGNVLNTTWPQGDALIGWPPGDVLAGRAAASRLTFIDSRRHLFPREIRQQLQQLRRALSQDDALNYDVARQQWQPILDQYDVSVVMVNAGATYPGQSLNTIGPLRLDIYESLRQSPNWILFYDDGNTALFGRADAPEADRAYFEANRLDPELWAYQKDQIVPSVDRPPSPVTWFDRVFQRRALTAVQPHVIAAQRWLNDPEIPPDRPALASPARCIMAIREARKALARKPDDPDAFRVLRQAYAALMVQEAALLAGIPLTPVNTEHILQTPLRVELQGTRFLQRATALNYAIQTTPPPRNPETRIYLRDLHTELGRLCFELGFLDLGRDQFLRALDLSQPGELPPDLRSELRQIDEILAEVEERLSELVIQTQAGPVERADFAFSQGAVGLAIRELEEAINVAAAKPRLFDLYLQTGQPDKAIELMGVTLADPSLDTGPGTAALRQGQASLLLGNYAGAASLWSDRAIPQLRLEQSATGLSAGQFLHRGEVGSAVEMFLELPSRVVTQAHWEADLGLCLLEAGMPGLAAERMTNALTLLPDHPMRPILEYYLEKLGAPIPPPSPESSGEASRPTETPEPASPEPSASDDADEQDASSVEYEDGSEAGP